MKCCIAVLLIAVLCFSMMPLPAYGEEPVPEPTASAENTAPDATDGSAVVEPSPGANIFFWAVFTVSALLSVAYLFLLFTKSRKN